MRYVLALCLLVILGFSEVQAADDKKLIVRDVNGRTVTSTRTLENGTLVLRDAYGRTTGYATKNQDGSYTIKTPYGQRVENSRLNPMANFPYFSM